MSSAGDEENSAMGVDWNAESGFEQAVAKAAAQAEASDVDAAALLDEEDEFTRAQLEHLPASTQDFDGPGANVMEEEAIRAELEAKYDEAGLNTIGTAIKKNTVELYMDGPPLESDDNPYLFLKETIDVVMGQEDGKAKKKDLLVMAYIAAIMRVARDSPGLRDYTAKQFGMLKAYKDHKALVRDLTMKNKVLEEIYNRKEVAAALKAIEQRQTARQTEREAKAKAKAESNIEKVAKKQKTGAASSAE